jgi:GTP-binding protein LepA
MATGAVDMIERVGVFTPKATPVDALRAGEIGFITAGIKAVADCRVGNTVTEDLGGELAPRVHSGAR